MPQKKAKLINGSKKTYCKCNFLQYTKWKWFAKAASDSPHTYSYYDNGENNNCPLCGFCKIFFRDSKTYGIRHALKDCASPTEEK